MRGVDEVENSITVATGGGGFVELSGITEKSASKGGLTERGLVARRCIVCYRSPEARRGDVTLPVVSAELTEVIRESVQRHAWAADLAVGHLLTATGGAGTCCAGAGCAGADAGERPADAPARNGRVGQGLLQPVFALGVPFGIGQVPGRGCFQEGPRQADPVPPGNSIVLLTCPFRLRGWCGDGWLTRCCSRSSVC